jgi:hypothetical protein
MQGRVEREDVVLRDADRGGFLAHVQDGQDGQPRPVRGGVLGGLPYVLRRGLPGDRGTPLDLELSGDVVMADVEEAEA